MDREAESNNPDRLRNREEWDQLRAESAKTRLEELRHEGGTWPGWRRRVLSLKDDGTPVNPRPHPLLIIFGLTVASCAVLVFGWRLLSALFTEP